MKRILKIRFKYPILIGISFIVVIAAIALFTPLFDVRYIKVVGANHIGEREIILSLPFGIGDNILFIPARKTEKTILKDGRIASVAISRKLPNSVEIIIEEENPVLLLAHEGIWGISEKGKLLPFESPFQIPNLPILSGIGADAILVPYYVPASHRFILGMNYWREIKRTSPGFLDKISEIHICEDSSLQLILTSDGLVVDFGKEDIGKNIKRLEAILDDLGSDRILVQKIDLRYGNQAIVELLNKKKQKTSG